MATQTCHGIERVLKADRWSLLRVLCCQVVGVKRMLLCTLAGGVLVLLLLCCNFVRLLALWLTVQWALQYPDVLRLVVGLFPLICNPSCRSPQTVVAIEPTSCSTGSAEKLEVACRAIDLEGHLTCHGALLFRGWLSGPINGAAFREVTDVVMERLKLSPHMFQGGYNPRILVHDSTYIFAPRSPLLQNDTDVPKKCMESLASTLNCIWNSPKWKLYLDSHHTELAYSRDKPDFFALYCHDAPPVGGGLLLGDERNALRCLQCHPLGRAILAHGAISNFVLHDNLPEDRPELNADRYFAESHIHTSHGRVSDQDRANFLKQCWGDSAEDRAAIINKNGFVREKSQKSVSVVPVRANLWFLLAPYVVLVCSSVYAGYSKQALVMLVLCFLHMKLNMAPAAKEPKSAFDKVTYEIRVDNVQLQRRSRTWQTEAVECLGFFAPFYGARYSDNGEPPSTSHKAAVSIAHWLSSIHLELRPGDIVFVDNNLVSHSRGLPWQGRRNVYSAQFRMSGRCTE